MNRLINRRLLITALVAVVWISVCLAHYNPRMKLWELVDASDLIVTGNVIDITSEWDLVDDEIYTLIAVEIDSVIKGDPTLEAVVVYQAGGTVDSVSEFVTGSSWWAIDAEVLLFLQMFEPVEMRFITVNLWQGKLATMLDQDEAEILFWDPALQYPQSEPEDSIAPAFDGQPQQLSDMISDIEALL